MESFRWSLLKSLEFVNSRRPDLEVRANFLQQLQSYTKRKMDAKTGKKLLRSEEWEETMQDLDDYKGIIKNLEKMDPSTAEFVTQK